MYKIFGKDFLDGFTSKTIKSNQEKKERKENTHNIYLYLYLFIGHLYVK